MSNASVLDVTRVQSVCQRRVETRGVRLEWDPRADTAYTDGKRIVLPALKHPVTNDQLDVTYGYVIHECGHHDRPEIFDILNTAQPPPALGALTNITEDDGMERMVGTRFSGDGKALGTMNRLLNEKAIEHWKNKIGDDPLSEDDAKPLAALALGQLSRTEWDDQTVLIIRDLLDNLDPTVTKLTNELVKEGWVERFRETETPFDTWDLACDLFRRLYDLSPEQEEALKKIQENGEAGGKGEPPPHANPQKGEEGDEEVESLAAISEGGVIPWDEAVLSDHDEWQPKDSSRESAGGFGIDWRGYNKDKRSPGLMPLHEIDVIDLKKPVDAHWGGCSANVDEFTCQANETAALGNKLRRYMQATSRVKHRSERLEGQLDKRNIVKLKLPPVDGGEWNKKIFRDQVSGKFKNTCVHVLVDWSGSMLGSPMENAADAAGRLVLVCDRILKIPVQIAAFTDATARCTIGMIKPFKERSISAEELGDRFAKFYPYSCANNDADALNWAYNQILARKEERKILVVFSDGAPVTRNGYGGNPGTNLKFVTEEIEKDKRVELYGIGLASDAVTNYYTNHDVIENTDEISRVLFDTIKKGAKQ